MGFWNDGLSSSRPRSRSRSHDRRSPSRNYGSKPVYSRSSSSFFGLPNTSTASHQSSSSKRYYSSSSRAPASRAQPRQNFTSRLIRRMRRFLRDLYYYMQKHPFKVLVFVIMPLLTGGILTKILAQFGVKLPRGLEEMMGGGRSGGSTNERYFARGGARDFESGSNLPGMASNVQGMLKVAKMFM